MKKSIQIPFTLLFIFPLVLATCDGILKATPSLKMNKTYCVLLIGENSQLEAKVSPKNSTNSVVVWSSGNDAIAAVSDTGLVTAKAPGITTVTASLEDDAITINCEITVAPMASVKGVTIVPSSPVSVLVGSGHYFRTEMNPANAANTNIIWSSSNLDVATISERGYASGLTEGESIITATTEDGGFTSTTTIKVIPNIVPVTSVDLPATTTFYINDPLIILGGSGLHLDCTIGPSNATNTNLCWASTNPKIISVDQTGRLSLHKTGIADIVVMAEDGAFTDRTTVTVDTMPSPMPY